MAAFRRLLTEVFVKIKQLAERSPSHHVHDPAVVLGSLRREAVRAVFLQFVRQVPAGDQDDPLPGLFRRPCDDLAQAVMIRKRQPGQADPYDLPFDIPLPDEAQRDHRAVIERRIPLSQRSRGKSLRVRQFTDPFHEIRVIALRKTDAARTEAPERAGRLPAGRNVKIVRIHHGMRTGYNDCIRLKAGHLFSDLLIRLRRFPDLFLLALPDFRDDQRRMRNHKGGQNRHHITSTSKKQGRDRYTPKS